MGLLRHLYNQALSRHKAAAQFVIRHSSFVIRHLSFVIRHSSFTSWVASPLVIRHSSFVILLIAGCTTEKVAFRPEEVQKRVVDSFPEITDTAFIGVVNLSQDEEHHWLIAYNEEQAPAVLRMYDATDRTKAPHILRIKRAPCWVEKVELNDVTHDGVGELVVYLRYDYGISYQGREIVVYENPFDSSAANIRDIFSHPLLQIWERIDSFESEFGMPRKVRTKGTDMSVEIFEDVILLQGLFENQKNRRKEFKWSKEKQIFELIRDEQLHERSEDEKNRPQVEARSEEGKLLLEVVAHDEGCRSFVLENKAGNLMDLPDYLRSALLCSPITTLSPDGRYLVYTNRKGRMLEYYDFNTKRSRPLLERIGAIEGISEIVWAQANKQLYAACILTNPEEYIYNTRIYIFKINAQAQSTTYTYEQPAWYECRSRTGTCTARKEDDYRFNNKNNFVFRLRRGEQITEEFATIELPK